MKKWFKNKNKHVLIINPDIKYPVSWEDYWKDNTPNSNFWDKKDNHEMK